MRTARTDFTARARKVALSVGLLLAGITLIGLGIVTLPLALLLRTLRERQERARGTSAPPGLVVRLHEFFAPALWVGLSLVLQGLSEAKRLSPGAKSFR